MLCWPAGLPCLDVGLWARQWFVGKEGGSPCHPLTGPTCGLMHFLPGLLYWSAPPVHILPLPCQATDKCGLSGFPYHLRRHFRSCVHAWVEAGPMLMPPLTGSVATNQELSLSEPQCPLVPASELLWWWTAVMQQTSPIVPAVRKSLQIRRHFCSWLLGVRSAVRVCGEKTAP